jgi:hypothetical protein
MQASNSICGVDNYILRCVRDVAANARCTIESQKGFLVGKLIQSDVDVSTRGSHKHHECVKLVINGGRRVHSSHYNDSYMRENLFDYFQSEFAR